MIYFLAIISFITLLISYRITKLIEHQDKRQEIFEKWMFDSLYSIDKNVVLPETVAPTEFKKAKVFAKNPMNEFTGLLDDRDLE